MAFEDYQKSVAPAKPSGAFSDYPVTKGRESQEEGLLSGTSLDEYGESIAAPLRQAIDALKAPEWYKKMLAAWYALQAVGNVTYTPGAMAGKQLYKYGEKVGLPKAGEPYAEMAGGFATSFGLPAWLKAVRAKTVTPILGKNIVQMSPETTQRIASEEAEAAKLAKRAVNLQPPVRTTGIGEPGVKPGTTVTPKPQYKLPGEGVVEERVPETVGPRYKLQPPAEGTYLKPPDHQSAARPNTVFDPNVPPTIPPPQTYWQRLKKLISRKMEALPQDAKVLRTTPKSPVLTDIQAWHARTTDDLDKLLSSPMATTLPKYSMKDWVTMEWKAVNLWKQGGQTPEAYEKAVQTFPSDIQALLRYRQQRLAIDQASRTTLGLPDIPELTGPYLPRLTDKAFREVVEVYKGGSGMHQDLTTTVKSFQKSRVYDTMAEGMSKGVEYEDPRQAWLMREWLSIKLERTAKLITSLEGKVLFRTRAEALAASPVKQAIEVTGLPGSEKWFATSRPEAVFLQQNLASRPGILGIKGAVHYANQLFRTPNLVNPLPHFTKNMLAKYGLSGGNMVTVWRDMLEFYRGSNPETLAQFKKFVPYAESGEPTHELMANFIGRNLLEKGLHSLSYLNKMSSHAIFQILDPGLRYARWKQYVAKGMDLQEAANHVQLDLIRYETRSGLVDMWKSIPMNFFVPWRYGTGVSVWKQLTSRPIKAALFIGAVDLLRETRYRETGRWTHLPWDYWEGPVVQMVKDPKMAPILAASFRVLGPGGAFVAGNLADAFLTLRGQGRSERLVNMFWGLSQLYNLPKEYKKYQETGDTKHLIDMIATIAVAEHSALRYKPFRVMEAVPESVLPYAPKVKEALAKQSYLQSLRERREKSRSLRPKRDED